ncbi:MAG: hypothetical protein ACP59X_10355 [Solidesulfovibrio sp. DCME]|uniref:hypothetical protein n=1 Tax=Solidesulfovibrio sp. DCME TaxID=3447380 RepID=UPI003D1317D4
MPKANNDKYRFDVYCQRENGLSLIAFCKSNGVSVNSMINHLIVSFLLNKNKYAFNFVDGDEQPINNQQKNTLHVENNENDNENFPDIIKELLENKDNGDNLDYSF